MQKELESFSSLEGWQQFSSSISYQDIKGLIDHPLSFQTELAEIINSINIRGKILEIGCEFGVMSLLLDQSFQKHLLDFDNIALDIAKRLFSESVGKAEFFLQDMFSTKFSDETFDIVFNAGVIEHFNSLDRKRLMSEYSRIVKRGGYLVIAFPNHYSKFYRLAYFLLNLVKRWSFPKEFKLFDLKEELPFGVTLEKRIICGKDHIFRIWGKYERIARYFGKVIPDEGYLTVLIFKKDV